MKIKIGVVDYDARMVSSDVMLDMYGDHHETASDTVVGGYIHPMYGVLYVNKDLPKQQIAQSFFHECVHAMLDEIGQDELSCNEGFVDSFAKQIYGFLKNNNLEKIYTFLGVK